jgi:eukaryotic-like serine/threonine-protein kinase
LMGILIGGGGLLGRHEELPRLGQLLMRTTPEPEATAVYLEALSLLCSAASWVGAHPQAVILLERMNEVGTEAMAREPLARGWVLLARNFFHYLLEPSPWHAFVHAEQGTRAFLEAGAESSALTTRALSGQALAALGDLPGAEEQLRPCLNTSRQAKQSLNLSVARTHLAATLASSPDPAHWEEARALALEELADTSPQLHAGWAQLALARVALHRGELAEAETQAHKSRELLAAYPPYRLFARTLLSTALLAQGRTAEAREMAALGVGELGLLGRAGTASVGVHLALAEACLAQGDTQEGEAALRQALHCVRSRASDIPDTAVRERFLHQVPENARTLALARQRWGEAERP